MAAASSAIMLWFQDLQLYLLLNVNSVGPLLYACITIRAKDKKLASLVDLASYTKDYVFQKFFIYCTFWSFGNVCVKFAIMAWLMLVSRGDSLWLCLSIFVQKCNDLLK